MQSLESAWTMKKNGQVTSKYSFITNVKQFLSNQNTNYLRIYGSARGGCVYGGGRGGVGGYYGIRLSGSKGNDEDPATPWTKQWKAGTGIGIPTINQSDALRDAPVSRK